MKDDTGRQLPLRLRGSKKWLRLGSTESRRVRDTVVELGQFGGALGAFFVVKLSLILGLLVRAGLLGARAFPDTKVYIVRKLIWSRGRLGRPVAHAAVLGLASGVFLTGGLLSGTSIVRSETIKGDVLIASADILPGVSAPTTESPVDRPRTEPIEYLVQGGDTLSLIGEKFKISVDTIRYANDLGDADYLSVGQELTILPVSGLEYAVKSGDTVQGIAEKYRVAPQVVIDFNYLEEPFALQIGQALIIPGAVVPTLVVAPATPATSVPGYSSSYAYGYQPSPAEDTVGALWAPRWPTNSRYITQYFSYWHPAIDIAEFSPIYAAAV
ncbi:LysM peptidoglycan-binding domain-containing protein, partial [Candidatus Parcubacteria bacterium]|nr:LysM peptidoglycan-binding domain-containing protein [Candidatus Parcubacteria bacterium]